MRKEIEYLIYGLGYLVKTKIFRKEIPFIGGLVINERCNLSCAQCRVSNRDIPDLSYEDTTKGLKTFYEMGIRSVFLEGGEPFLWRDGEYRLEDIIGLARRTGFKAISVYTNGTFPIDISSDTVFVSIDGLRETNNKLRGNVYDRVMQNIKNSAHTNINVNFTINRHNRFEIDRFCREIQKIKQIKGIFFYFHTPYYGMDELFLTLDEKREIIEEILAMKKQGFKILNSEACLRGVYKDNWKRPSKICYVYADNKLYQCCRAFGNEEVCKNCGYLGYPEIIYILKLHPTAILSALNYLPKTHPATSQYI